LDVLTYAHLSQRVNQLTLERDGEWCGIPMPMPGSPIVIEPRNPWRERIEGLSRDFNPEPEVEPTPDGTFINEWYSARLGCHVAVVRYEGRCRVVRYDYRSKRRVDRALSTLIASQAWNLEVELTALDTLATLIKPHMADTYILTGMFLETSRRSGLTYIFRRLAPTLVMSPRHRWEDGREQPNAMRLLCALCLHPIGYYTNSHAGAMVPTDDVIAHLLMMRGDEPLFWRRANQHSPHSPEAHVMI
jgi:hypothetical protein